MALTERNIRNIFIYALPRYVSYGLNIIVLPILTRFLTPKDFGIVTLALAFPTIAVAFFSGGMTFGAQRYYFEYRKDKQKLDTMLFSSQVFFFIILAISAGVVFYFRGFISAVSIGNSKYGWAVFIAFINLFLAEILNFYLVIYQNMEKAAVHAFFTILNSTVTNIASVIFVWYFSLSYLGLIYGTMAGTVVAWIGLVFHFNKRLKPSFNGQMVLQNIKYGIQLVPKSLTAFINRFFDKYMLSHMLSLSAVGIYNIGQTVGNGVFFLMSTSWRAFQPVTFREVFDKGDEGSVTVGRLFTIFCYLTLTPVLLLILFAQEVIFVVAPASYYGAIDVIIVILAGIATQTFGEYISVQYAYTKKAFFIFPVTVIGTLANIIANIILIPRFGLIGAAISMVLSYFTVNSLLTLIGQRLYRIAYQWREILALFFIIAAAIVSVLYLRSVETSWMIRYVVKLIIICLFVFSGVRANVFTKESLKKVKRAVWPGRKIEEAQV